MANPWTIFLQNSTVHNWIGRTVNIQHELTENQGVTEVLKISAFAEV